MAVNYCGISFITLLPCGLYCKHIVIVNYDSSIVNKFGASLTDDARVIICDHHMFIVQVTVCQLRTLLLTREPSANTN